MPSKITNKETKNKKTKKIKIRLKMLVSLQPIYLLNLLGMSSKLFCATFCHFKKSKNSFTKTSLWEFLDLKPTHFAVRIAAPPENDCSTTEELGESRDREGVVLQKYIHPNLSIH